VSGPSHAGDQRDGAWLGHVPPGHDPAVVFTGIHGERAVPEPAGVAHCIEIRPIHRQRIERLCGSGVQYESGVPLGVRSREHAVHCPLPGAAGLFGQLLRILGEGSGGSVRLTAVDGAHREDDVLAEYLSLNMVEGSVQ